MESHDCLQRLINIICCAYFFICCAYFFICCAYFFICCAYFFICCAFVIIRCANNIICGAYFITCGAYFVITFATTLLYDAQSSHVPEPAILLASPYELLAMKRALIILRNGTESVVALFYGTERNRTLLTWPIFTSRM